MTQIQPIKYGHSEVSPRDDYAHLKPDGFRGFNNDIDDPKRERRDKWAKDTAGYANNSIYAHLAELLLRVPSYFISHSDLKDKWWAKGINGLERISGTLGDMFRNWIYGHRDLNGNMDDNVGAEIHAGANENYSLGVINNFTQTKGKFITAALSFISPSLANDIDWAVVHVLDGWWWRNMGANIAYGADFSKKLINRLIGSTNSQEEVLTWDSIKNQFSKNLQAFKNSTGDFLGFCQNTDRLVSSFLPLVSCLNTIGDILRPIARRLDLTGFLRNSVRLLSIIDRPFMWVTNFFRFYLPEKYIQKNNNKDNEHKLPMNISHSDLLLGSIVGDMADFGLTIFEDKIKESSGNLNHLVEIARRLKDSASNIYFSRRRKRALEELPKQSA